MCRDSTKFFRKRTYKQPLMTILDERVLSAHLNGVLQLDGAFYVDWQVFHVSIYIHSSSTNKIVRFYTK